MIFLKNLKIYDNLLLLEISNIETSFKNLNL